MVNDVTSDQIPSLQRAGAGRALRSARQKRSTTTSPTTRGGFAPFADPEVRRALGAGHRPRRQLIQALQMEELAEPAGGPYAPIFRDLYDPERMPPAASTTRSAPAQILRVEGLERTPTATGSCEKDGQPFRFTLVTNAGNQRRADAAQIIQQQWRQIGVDAQLQQLEFNTFMQNLMRQASTRPRSAAGAWGSSAGPDHALGRRHRPTTSPASRPGGRPPASARRSRSPRPRRPPPVLAGRPPAKIVAGPAVHLALLLRHRGRRERAAARHEGRHLRRATRTPGSGGSRGRSSAAAARRGRAARGCSARARGWTGRSRPRCLGPTGCGRSPPAGEDGQRMSRAGGAAERGRAVRACRDAGEPE